MILIEPVLRLIFRRAIAADGNFNLPWPWLSRVAARAYRRRKNNTGNHPAPGQDNGAGSRVASDPGGSTGHGRIGPQVP
jgi:hypothetical protein